MQLFNRLEFSSQSSWVLTMLLFEFSKKILSIIVETDKLSRRLSESTFEVISCPLNGVFDLVGEVFKSTKWNTFLWRVDDVSIANSGMRDNYL